MNDTKQQHIIAQFEEIIQFYTKNFFGPNLHAESHFDKQAFFAKHLGSVFGFVNEQENKSVSFLVSTQALLSAARLDCMGKIMSEVYTDFLSSEKTNTVFDTYIWSGTAGMIAERLDSSEREWRLHLMRKLAVDIFYNTHNFNKCADFFHSSYKSQDERIKNEKLSAHLQGVANEFKNFMAIDPYQVIGEVCIQRSLIAARKTCEAIAQIDNEVVVTTQDTPTVHEAGIGKKVLGLRAPG